MTKLLANQDTLWRQDTHPTAQLAEYNARNGAPGVDVRPISVWIIATKSLSDPFGSPWKLKRRVPSGLRIAMAYDIDLSQNEILW